jgi:hypothetical protein
MEGDDDSRFFLAPEQTVHRRYEALRATVVDGEPVDRVAERFGYKTSALRSMVSRFRADRRRGATPPCYEAGCQVAWIESRSLRGSACYSCSGHRVGSAIANEGRHLFTRVIARRGRDAVTSLADPRWLGVVPLRLTSRSGGGCGRGQGRSGVAGVSNAATRPLDTVHR